MLSSLSRLIWTLSAVAGVYAVPLGIEYDRTTGLSAAEQANVGRLDAATTAAHAQVGNMRTAIDRAKTGDANALNLYHTAFGHNADINKVDATISKLETGNIKAQVATHPFQNGEIAAVPWSKDDVAKTPWTPGHAQFSDQFHGGGTQPLNNAGRAGTIIHEATHQLAKTGDDINKSGNIIKPYDGTSKPTGATGYTSNHNMHTTVAQVNADQAYTDVRDSAKNMHDNAESYAVFGSLCSQPGALRRRDLKLYNRALVADDHENLYRLARRNSCQLPKDYFAKKAAAKKAAEAKAKGGAAAVKPTDKSKVAATKKTLGTKALGAKATSKKGSVARLNAKGSKALRGSRASLKGGKLTTKGGLRSGLKGAKALKNGKLTTKGGLKTGLKGAKALTKARGTKGGLRTGLKGAKALKNSKLATKGGLRTGAKALTKARGAKGAAAGRLLKKTTAKGLKRPSAGLRSKTTSRTAKGPKAASKLTKSRTQGLKSSKAQSRAKAASRTLKGAASRVGAKRVANGQRTPARASKSSTARSQSKVTQKKSSPKAAASRLEKPPARLQTKVAAIARVAKPLAKVALSKGKK